MEGNFMICGLWFLVVSPHETLFCDCGLCFSVFMFYITQICYSKAGYIFTLCDLCFMF